MDDDDDDDDPEVEELPFDDDAVGGAPAAPAAVAAPESDDDDDDGAPVDAGGRPAKEAADAARTPLVVRVKWVDAGLTLKSFEVTTDRRTAGDLKGTIFEKTAAPRPSGKASFPSRCQRSPPRRRRDAAARRRPTRRRPPPKASTTRRRFVSPVEASAS